MIVPKILPDEFWLGYFIRLSNINGVSYRRKALRQLDMAFKKKDEKKSPSVPIMLSRVLNISSEQFCRFHTLLPVLRAVVANISINANRGDQREINVINYHSQMIVNRELKSCQECIKEDKGYHGFAYFRREHQLPGFNYCSKHNLKLIRSSRDEFVNPDQVMPFEDHYEIVDDEITNGSVQRYKAIIDSWASAGTPIPLSQLTVLMQTRARNIGLRWSRVGNKRLLSDLILKSYPIAWLKILIPDIHKKSDGKYFSAIDSVMTPQNISSRSSIYALALSVLFDSAEESLNAAYACINSNASTSSKGKKRNVHGIRSNSKLDRIYIESKGVSSDIARKMGIGDDSTIQLLIKNGLIPLGNIRKKVLFAFMDFQGGLGMMESCLKHGAKISDLEQLLRKSATRQQVAVQSIMKNDQTAMIDIQTKSRSRTFTSYAVNPCIVQ